MSKIILVTGASSGFGRMSSQALALAQIIAKDGRLDVVVHNAGHMSFGPAEAFTPPYLAPYFAAKAAMDFSASVPSACTSTPRKTAPKSSTESPIACAPSCYEILGSSIS